MKSNTETENLFDHRTKLHDFGDQTGEDIAKDQTFITVLERNSIILIHSPSDKSVSIGRSRQNNIYLSNPHFPRKAAEVILGPLPLLRKTARTGEKSHEIVQISPGKPFKINPYKFCLLKTGDILVNRYKKIGCSKKPRKWVVIFIAAIVLTVFAFYHFIIASNFENTDSEVTVELVAEKNKNTLHTEKSMHQRMMKFPSGHPNTSEQTKKYNITKIKDGDHPKTQGIVQIRSNDSKKVSIKKSEKESLLKKHGIPANELELLIQTAIRSIKHGHPEQAGRMIFPILSHLSREQESHLIHCLEPSMKFLFQKAYMLREYNRSAARVTLDKIVRSELYILPSYTKAKEILDSEKKFETTFGKSIREENN